MTQHFSKQPLRTPPAPFSEAQDPTVTSGLFWARLLAYRPLFLLGGLWLALVCVSAIAYHGLMFNEPIEDATYSEAPLTVAEALPPSLPTAADTADAAPADATAPGPVTSAPVALWALFSLVGLCGFGCFVLTQQIRASARPTKHKKTRPRPVVKAPAPHPQPKRLAPYSPQRDGVVVPGHRIVEAAAPPLPVPSPLVSPQPPVAPRPPSPAVARPVANRPQADPRPKPLENRSIPPTLPVASLPSHNPAVVPNEADLALDWPEGSVAHALDVRQRRSLSSFM
ncbi:hypothetical protein IQ265_23025 [Nodosilinea sp. LEGE 06152]|uniref:hypothetical protein n=1 Tax=Nodosilinea sp. LEGE 06152 TaxID=2777966 RepID=UPI00187E48DC|nr:hypothetical protein [Nodosilinea sp. LEGE 06152]MBE9159685.1 hypothetical protein [Nodosilinea sp. LEGE 06152]